jgi:hypothetical protein
MSSGGGYSGGMGGFGGGFGQPPMFGGGFGQQFPSYGGGFGAFGPQPYTGFGGGFGQPQQFGGGFGQPQQSPFGGGSQGPMLQAQGPNTFGNAYAQRFQRPSVGMFPPTSPDPNQPPPGMELNPDYNLPPGTFTTANTPRGRFRPIQQPQTGNPPPGMIRNPDYRGPRQVPEGMFTTMDIRPSEIEFISDPNYVPTGGGRPSNDQFFGNTQTFLPTIEPTPAQPAPQQGFYSPYMNQPFQSGLSGMLSSGLGGMFGGYQAMPFGGYQPNYQAAQQQMALKQQELLKNPGLTQTKSGLSEENSNDPRMIEFNKRLNERIARDRARGYSLDAEYQYSPEQLGNISSGRGFA